MTVPPTMPAELTAILALTDEVQAAIDGGDWLRAGELEETRRGRLESLLATSTAAELAPGAAMRTALEALDERGRHLVGTAHHHRRRLLREASLVKTGAAAVDAYGRTAAADIP